MAHKPRVMAIAMLAAFVAPGSASAQGSQPIRAETLSQCMIANSKPEHEEQMRKVMIDALQENTESLNSSLLLMSMSVIAMAQQSCGLKMSDLQSPEFEAGMEAYGQFMGEKIFTKAMSKLGQ
jgi:hypothetical protein